MPQADAVQIIHWPSIFEEKRANARKAQGNLPVLFRTILYGSENLLLLGKVGGIFISEPIL